MTKKKPPKVSCMVCSQGHITQKMIREAKKFKRLVCRFCGAIHAWDWDKEKLMLDGVRHRRIP